MQRYRSLAFIAVAALAVAAPRWADKAEKKDPRARITLYRIAPGKHADFLKWMAAQDEVARQAGVPTIQLYAHLDGDSWDFLGIAPVTTPEQDKKLDEIAAGKGLKVGLAASFEFRELVAWHTDTQSAGPTSAADLLAMLPPAR
jgi:hypothetical protein